MNVQNLLGSLVLGSIMKVSVNNYATMVLTDKYLYVCGAQMTQPISSSNMTLEAKNVLSIQQSNNRSVYITPYMVFEFDHSKNTTQSSKVCGVNSIQTTFEGSLLFCSSTCTCETYEDNTLQILD